MFTGFLVILHFCAWRKYKATKVRGADRFRGAVHAHRSLTGRCGASFLFYDRRVTRRSAARAKVCLGSPIDLLQLTLFFFFFLFFPFSAPLAKHRHFLASCACQEAQ
jgi:hypothetical protein